MTNRWLTSTWSRVEESSTSFAGAADVSATAEHSRICCGADAAVEADNDDTEDEDGEDRLESGELVVACDASDRLPGSGDVNKRAAGSGDVRDQLPGRGWELRRYMIHTRIHTMNDDKLLAETNSNRKSISAYLAKPCFTGLLCTGCLCMVGWSKGIGLCITPTMHKQLVCKRPFPRPGGGVRKHVLERGKVLDGVHHGGPRVAPQKSFEHTICILVHFR